MKQSRTATRAGTSERTSEPTTADLARAITELTKAVHALTVQVGKLTAERAAPPADRATIRPEESGGVMVYGIPAIAKHLGLTTRQAKHLHDTGRLPTFTPPGSRRVAAKRDTLNALLKQWETAGPAPH